MDYGFANLLQTAITNYDVSDIMNQTFILLLLGALFVKLNIKFKFSDKKGAYYY
jgi:hypothetical protein